MKIVVVEAELSSAGSMCPGGRHQDLRLEVGDCDVRTRARVAHHIRVLTSKHLNAITVEKQDEVEGLRV